MGNALRALNSDEIAGEGPLDGAILCRLAVEGGATRAELDAFHAPRRQVIPVRAS